MRALDFGIKLFCLGSLKSGLGEEDPSPGSLSGLGRECQEGVETDIKEGRQPTEVHC